LRERQFNKATKEILLLLLIIIMIKFIITMIINMQNKLIQYNFSHHPRTNSHPEKKKVQTLSQEQIQKFTETEKS